MRRLKVLIWHLHGAYLYYLTKNPSHEFYVPFKPDRLGDYSGKSGHIPWPENLQEIPAEDIRNLDFDCIIFQSRSQYEKEQFEILSSGQCRLPKIYIEHDPPQEHPTNTLHWVDDTGVLLVHVTPFNQLMWDSGRTPSVSIDHGVEEYPHIQYSGKLNKGIVIVNNMKKRGRRLGFDVYQNMDGIPLDHIGLGSLDVPGGIGEVIHKEMPAFISQYRFMFNPIRYTSLGLAVCEAMMCGIPVVALATTEMATVIENGKNGYADTRIDRLAEFMRKLLADHEFAAQLGEGAKKYARERFSLQRFHRDWNSAFSQVTGFSQRPKKKLQTAFHEAGTYETE